MIPPDDSMMELFNELEQAMRKLKMLSKVSKEEFLSNYEKIDSAKYNFVVAIETMINTGNQLISRGSLGLPEEYADIFHLLSQEGIFPEEFEKKLIDMVKFRNLLVHVYGKVDNEKVYDIFRTNLEDFGIFEEHARKYLRAKK